MKQLLPCLLLLCLSFNLIGQELKIPTSDSVDALVVYYSAYGDHNSIINYQTYITQEHVILYEEYIFEGNANEFLRYYPINGEKHLADRGYGLVWYQNDLHISSKTHVDSIMNIAGYPCHLATYYMNGKKCKAYFTDAFGVNFSTTADYPGFALYYERHFDFGTWKFLADSVEPMRIPVDWLYPSKNTSQVKDINNTKRTKKKIGQKPKSNRTYKKTKYRLVPGRTYKFPINPNSLSYRTINNRLKSKQEMSNKIVLIQFLQKFEDKTEGHESLIKTLQSKYSSSDLQIVIASFENKKEFNKENLNRVDYVDYVLNAKNLQKKYKLEDVDGFILLDHNGFASQPFKSDRDDLEEALDESIEYLVKRRNLEAN